ncbi:hypothetical protein GCM10009069_25860 [Algimonas arctica]|uniref:Uncharacterized protein n=1 Tax=Algimonas arctica TaxID=1479486 RepID=A0A8J3CU44_9PROT|nr:hypothetical protein [Algimonas arctica]GHB01908.1 hypothetical protein GCM10009069_25860 [Algimonas arctica]
MKFIRIFIGLFTLIMMGFVLSATYAQSAGAEVSVQRPNTDIAVIHFRGGRLVQSTEQYGRWFEKRNNGVINYEFFETASTAQSIELTGPNGQVKLFVDLTNKIIKGQWPGQAPKPIYTITKIEQMVFIQTPGTQPPVVQPPVVAPPVAHPPVVTPPVVNPSAPLPKDLMSATYVGGQFMQVSDVVWEQNTENGEAFHLQVVGYDEHSLYLYDASRHTFVTLEPRAKRSRIAVGGDYLRPFQTLTTVSAEPHTPIPPVPNGTLSQADKLACVQRGGYVERAGMLGAERCTTPFSDGGLVCTDSNQCQGQCRGDLSSEMGASVSGVCQANDNPFGCFSEVVNGQAGPGLCVD